MKGTGIRKLQQKIIKSLSVLSSGQYISPHPALLGNLANKEGMDRVDHPALCSLAFKFSFLSVSSFWGRPVNHHGQGDALLKLGLVIGAPSGARIQHGW
jgi:hypothetical protein